MTATKKSDFVVVRNYDYTISIEDKKKKVISFRDISGNDLEFLESIFPNKETEEEENDRKYITFDNVVSILDRLNLQKINFNYFPKRITIEIFEHVKEHILCNYMPKYVWLSQCYAIQNGSFSGVLEMEKVPMTKFIAMIQAHQDAIESMKKET
jgi:hypothetical protein